MTMEYGTITGRLVAAVADTTTDVDQNPDIIPITGTVTFTPSVKAILVDSEDITVVPAPIVASLDSQGCVSLNGVRSVTVLATDSEYYNPNGWTYKVSFDNLAAAGRRVTFDSYSIAVPAGTTVDLSAVTPVPSSGGQAIVRGPKGLDADEIAPQVRGVKYVAYGHSFGQVQAPVNTTPAGLYPLRVRDMAGADPASFANNTVSGASMGDIAARAQSTWTQGTYGLITMLGNQNSVGNTHADANAKVNYKSALRSFLNWVRGGTTFPPTVVLVKDTTCTSVGYARYSPPPTDADVNRFNRYLTEVASEYPSDGSILIADALAGWDPNTMTAPDGQHPNDRGSAHIASAILDALERGDFREGLNYGIAPSGAKNYVLSDQFNRADNASTLGTADTGQTWNVASGATFGIVSNQARTAGSFGESGYAWAESGLANIDFETVLGTATTVEGSGPVFRLTNSSNAFVVDCQVGGSAGNAITLYKRVNGAYSSLGSGSQVPKAGDTIRVVAFGANITVYVNGVVSINASDSFNQTATKHGIRITSNANGIDSIRVAAA